MAQIGVSFIPVADTAADIRELTYSAQQFWYKPSWENAGWVAVDLIGFIPIAGALKPVFKHGDDFVQSLPSSKKLRRNLELAGVEAPDYPNAAHHIVAGTASGG